MRKTNDEVPTAIEGLVDRFYRARTLVFVLAVAIAWIVFNRVLAQLGLTAIDPFPFRWLQWLLRVSIVVNTVIIFVFLRARSQHLARAARNEKAHRELLERFDSVRHPEDESLRAQTKHYA